MTVPPALDPRAVIEGRPPGRRQIGPIAGIAAGLLCALVALGADLVQSVGSSAHSVAPFLVAVLLALLPVPLLISIVLLLDRMEPEPRADLVFAFAWGAGIAVLLAALINTAGMIFITQPELGRSTGEFVSATFGAPVVEESLKGAALLWLLWRRRQEIDGPTDGIIYAAMVGLGFAMIENVGYYLDALIRPQVGGAELLGVTFVFRGLLSPFAHPVFTSMTGIGAAYAATHRRAGWAVGVGLAAAMIMHGTWNGLSALGLRGVAVGYALLICALGALAIVLVSDRRRVVGLIWRFLPCYQPDGVVTQADLRMLSTLRERRAARNWARSAGGRAGATAMTDYQLAATELALVHQRSERGMVSAAYFAGRKQALLTLMTAARDEFFHHQPEPPVPPWAQPGQSGFGRHRPHGLPQPGC